MRGDKPSIAHVSRRMGEVPTEILVERAKEGDQQAFNVLIARMRHRIESVVAGIIGPHDDVQDVVQVVCLNAWMKIHRFDASSKFETWLYRVAFNAAIDHLRKKRRRQTEPLDDSDASEPRASSDPFRDYFARDVSGILDTAIEKLSLEHFVVIFLREVKGLSYAEIAQRVEIPEGTVMSRIFHARKELQKVIQDTLGEGWRDSVF